MPTPERKVVEAVEPEPLPEMEVKPELEAEPSAAVVVEPVVEAPVASVDTGVTVPAGRTGGGALRAAWALSFVVLLAASWFAYAARESVMHAWPPSMRAYAALGLVAK